MNWTKERPKKAGYYFYDTQNKWGIVEIDHLLRVYIPGQPLEQKIEDFKDAEWYGPLMLPERKLIVTLQGIKGIEAKDVTIDSILKRAWKFDPPDPKLEPEITGFFVHPMDSFISSGTGTFELKIVGGFELKPKIIATKMELSEMDYRELLKRYMRAIEIKMGTTFVRGDPHPRGESLEELDLTKEDIAELEKIQLLLDYKVH